ncbi:uncharacterized protein [Littorina saxatilis]|uniref:uncharacterized protein n=1 Tax=Littorina saxatilis TaxID=31220 RepID=UPI0038B44E32
MAVSRGPFAQGRRLNTFHMRNLRRIIGIKWSDRVTCNNEVLEQAIMPSMYTLLRQRRLRWLGHVCRMEDGRIPKDLLYGELASGKRAQGRPQLRYRDVCKRDMKALDMDINGWEDRDRARWRQELKKSLAKGEEKLKLTSEAQRLKNKEKNSKVTTSDTVHKCGRCDRDCHSRIGPHSHSRRCSSAK